MKKFNLIRTLFFGALFFSSTGIIAQTIVSTTAQNKRVVLEEFTGIHCGFCPDGHEIAHDLQVAHPGVFFPIAIHQGDYATPGTGEPDYRTAFGNTLGTTAGASSIGWPCGTINRHLWTGSVQAMGRGSWTSYTTTALSQSSCVNIAISPSVDYTTRILTVLVEVYYTANSTLTTNKLNVAICQNNVKGPQTNYGPYNTSMITPDGKYLHQHMFRTFITGQWGFTLPTTTAGTFWDSTFTYTLPANYTNIPVEIPQLEIIAFVAEGNGEILTADGDGLNQPNYDASINAISNVPAYTCTGTFTPSCTIKNCGTSTLTSATINYSIDGGAANTYTWNGSLATGATQTVALPSVSNTVNGSHSLTISSSLPNGVADWNLVNDAYTTTFLVFTSAPIITPITQNFTSTTFPPTGYSKIDVGQDGYNWARSGTAGHTAAGSTFMNFYNIQEGQIDDFMLPKTDFTNITNTTLIFWMAHRQYAVDYIDQLEVDVSTDCGATWTQEWMKSGTALATNPTVLGTAAYTAPVAGDWRQETIDLSAYNGQADVMIRFRATSGYGNNAFVDDINLTGTTGIDNPDFNNVISLFPNPSNGNIYVISAENSTIEIVDMLGKVVYSNIINTNNEQLDLSGLSNGSYMARISNNKNVFTKNIVIVK